jgi:hypothetical protein
MTDKELIKFRHKVVWANMEKHYALALKHLRLKARWDKLESEIWHELVKRNL